MKVRGSLVVILLVLATIATSCSTIRPAAETVSAAPRPPAPTRPLTTVGTWQARFDAAMAGNRPEARRLAGSTDSEDFYTLAYTIDALTSMVEATGERRYADEALGYVTTMMDSARPSSSLPDSSFSDDHLGWASSSEGGNEVPLYESFCWRYVARLLRVIQEGPLGQDRQLAATAARVQAFADTEIVDKWMSRGVKDYVYRSNTHMASHWAYITMELARLTTDPERRARYRQVVSDIDNHLPNYPSSLRQQMRPARGDPDAYWWSDEWGETDGPGQDVAHGNAVVNYVVESNHLGSGWTAQDMRRFSNTLTSFVLRPAGRHPEFVDGTGNANGWIADGFVKLGRFDPAVQAQLEDYDVQNEQYYASMAANARLLGAA